MGRIRQNEKEAEVKTTKNYCYGVRASKIDADLAKLIDDNVYAAHKYRNQLCALELEKRERHEQLLQRLAPDYVKACEAVQKAEMRLGEVREKIQAERQKQRTKKPKGCEHLTNEASDLKSKLKELRQTRKETKKAAYENEAVQAAMEENTAKHKADCMTAKNESGLYWGTEALVRSSCGSFRSGAPPRFKRFEGEGQLAVQIQKGANSLYLCYIDNFDGKLATCNFRVASEPNGNPIFARIPIVFHRPLPENATVKWAYLEQRKMANKTKWQVRFTIDTEVDTDREKDSWCAIHYGWTMQPNGLRVAMWKGSDGDVGSVVLNHAHCDDYRRLDAVKSQRDNDFNDQIEALVEWLKDRDIAEFLAEVRPNLKKWRAHGKLASLVWRWRENRFEGDEEMFGELEVWRKADKHAWQHERRLSKRVFRRRKDLYRKNAKQLSDRYGVLYAAKIDAKQLAENSNPEDLERDSTDAHRHAKWAAVSELHGFMSEKFPLHVIVVDSKNLTRQCHNCGDLCVVNRRKVQCRGCGRTWDVDENALNNTIARGEASQKFGALLELQQEYEDAVQKKLDKLLKMQEAARKKHASRKAGQKPKSEKELSG